MRIFAITVSGFLVLAGCQAQEKTPPPPSTTQQTQEPRVHNSFTDYVDRGVSTMDRAKKASDAADANSQAQNQQVNKVQE